AQPRMSTTQLHVTYLSFFFHTPPPPDIYPLSLHDALPIWKDQRVHAREEGVHLAPDPRAQPLRALDVLRREQRAQEQARAHALRSEEHTSELQSPYDLVCRLLLEKKKKKNT